MAVAAGIAGLYLLLAVEITSLLRKRMPGRWWRRVHYTAFPLFVLVTLHGLSAGTDAHSGRVLLGVVAVTVLIAALVRLRLERVYTRRSVTSPARTAVVPAWAGPPDPLLVDNAVDVRSDLEAAHR